MAATSVGGGLIWIKIRTIAITIQLNFDILNLEDIETDYEL